MAKFRLSPLQHVVIYNDKYMQVKQHNIIWVDSPIQANKYASKYAAKEHLKVLTGVPEGVRIELLNGEK